ncbi:MAG: hypothetical protein ACRC6K_06720 [Fusobacteriaceae bacterium]
MKNRHRFRESVNKFYSKDILFRLYKEYFLDWIAEGFIGSSLGLFEISMITQNTNKQTFLDLIDQMFKPQNFEKIYKILPPHLKEVLEEIAWKGKFNIRKNREIYFKEQNNYDINKDLREEFLFFKAERDNKKEENLILNYDIVRELRYLLPEKPLNYNLRRDFEKASGFVSNDEELFMENIKIYYDFYKQGGVILSASGKILKDSKINMKKYCNITEYYEDIKDLQYLKTETIGLFFHLIKDDYINYESFKISNIKDLILSFLSGKLIKDEKFHYSFLYLNYLKGLKNILNTNEQLKEGLKTITKIIKEFPVTSVLNPKISLENIVDRIFFQDEFIEIIDIESAYEYIYINEANYERTKITSYERYQDYIAIPFIKSVFFILGAMGVVELYYEAPSSNNCLYLKNGHLSKYDGLKAVRLTEFGKYVFDLVDTYDFKDLKDEGEVILDEDRLIVTIIGEAPSKAMYLEKISTKISSNKFKITKDSFLKDIKTVEELKERIKVFKDKVHGDISEFWGSFFDELINKSSAINVIADYTVLKLKNDKELLTYVAKDERFKSFILKGENYHIFVKNDDMGKVINLFKEYGYSIDTLV